MIAHGFIAKYFLEIPFFFSILVPKAYEEAYEQKDFLIERERLVPVEIIFFE